MCARCPAVLTQAVNELQQRAAAHDDALRILACPLADPPGPITNGQGKLPCFALISGGGGCGFPLSDLLKYFENI